MSALGSLVVKLALEYAQFSQGLNSTEQEVKQHAKRVQDAYEQMSDGVAERMGRLKGAVVGALAGAVSVGGLIAAMSKIKQETIDAEQEQNQLAAAIKSTGQSAGWSQERLNDMAAALAKNSNFSEGLINQGQTRLLSYTGVVREQFPRAMQAILDMSARLGTEVTASAETIGKALDIPSEGLTALSKQGFRFSEEQKDLVKRLERVGDTAAAQGIILDALESSYGGAAKAARDSFGGAMTAVGETINSLMTADSASLPGLRASVEGLNEKLNSDQVKQGFQSLVGSLVDIGTFAASSVAGIVNLGQAVADHKGEIGVLIGTLAGAGTAAGLMSVAASLGGAAGMAGAIYKVRDAFMALTLVMAANPLGLVLVGLGAATGAAIAMNMAEPTGDKLTKEIEYQSKRLADAEALLAKAGGPKKNFTEKLEARIAGIRGHLDTLRAAAGIATPQVAAVATEVTGVAAAAEGTGATLGKSEDWIKKYGTAAEKAAVEVAEWKKKLGSAFTPEMQRQIEATYAKQDAGARAGAQSAKQLETAYTGLTISIEQKIAEQKLELESGEALNDADKMRIKFQQDLRNSLKGLTPAQQANTLAGLKAYEALIEENKARKQAAELLADERKYRQDLWSAQAKTVEELEAGNKSLRDEIELIGLSTAQQQMVLRQREEAVLLVKEQHLAELKRAEDASGFMSRERIMLEQEIALRRERLDLMHDKGVREAYKTVAEHVKADSEEVSKTIGSTLADYIMGGGRNAAQYLKRLFATLVLQPIVKTTVGGLFGSGASSAAGGAGEDGLGNLVSTGKNIYSALNSPMMSNFGLGVGMKINQVGTKMFELGMESAGESLMDFGVSVAEYADVINMAGNVIGYGKAIYDLSEGKIGSAVGTAIGQYWGGPIGAAIGSALGGLVDGLFAGDSGTKHMGAGAVYSKATGIQDGAGIYNQGTFAMGHPAEYSAAMQEGVSEIAKNLGQTLDAFAVSFGKTAGYSVATAFADDSSKDGAWGSLKILDGLGNKLIDWNDSRTSKWAPREFADGEEGLKQYQSALALDMKNVFLEMDLAGWADQILKTAKDIDTLNAALQQIATVKAVFEGLGKSMAMFSGISDDVQTRLLRESGGVDPFVSNAGSFYQSFYTEGERALKQRELQMDALGRMGLYIDPAEGDAAKELFRTTVESAMSSGQVELAAQLLAMSGAFAQTADYAQSLKGSLENVVDTIVESIIELRGPLIDLEARFSGGGKSRQYIAEDTASSLQALLSDAGIQTKAGDLATIMMSATSADVEHYFREIWKVLPTEDAQLELVGLANTMLDLAAATDTARESAAQTAAQSMSGAWSNFGTMAGLAAQYTGNTSGLSQQLGVVQGSYANATTTDGRVAALQQIINLEQGLWNGQQAARQAEAAAATARANAAREQVNAAKQLLSAAQSLGDYAKSLGFSEASGLDEAERLAALDGQRRDLLAKARAGDTGAMQELQGITGNYLTLAQQMAVSQQDYSVLSGRIAAELAATAAIQEASASSQVSQYERQIAAAESVASTSAEQFKVSAATQKLIDDLLVESATAFETEATLTQKLIDQGVMTTTALQNLPAELAGAIGSSLIPAIAGLTSAVIGATRMDGSHADGLPYVPFDGYRAYLHQGEEVVTAREAAQRRSRVSKTVHVPVPQSSQNLEIKVGRLETQMTRVANATEELLDLVDRVSAGGNAFGTEVLNLEELAKAIAEGMAA